MKNNFFLEKDIDMALTKNRALEEIAWFLSEKMKADSKSILNSIERRELVSSTGLEKGIAVPHAFIPTINEAYIAVISFKNPIKDWLCVDNTLVKKAVCLVLPEVYSAQTPNVKKVTQIFQLLANEDFINKVQKSQTSHELVGLLMNQLEKGGK